jgi:hypothetical protein
VRKLTKTGFPNVKLWIMNWEKMWEEAVVDHFMPAYYPSILVDKLNPKVSSLYA